MAFSRNGLMTAGIILAVLGLIGFAIPVITTQETTEVARIGDLKVKATTDKSYPISPFLAGGALLLGVVLIGAGATRR
jgi:hypothetical protein